MIVWLTKYSGELALLAFLPLGSCIEPFETEFIDFEDAFVVNATITNEMKQQEISLTRTYRFQDDGPSGESGASVAVIDSYGNTYTFLETEAGKYRSSTAFAAAPNTDYQLTITSNSGRRYVSTTMTLPSTNRIDSLYAERITNDFGEDGIGIFASTSSSTETSNFYSYQYEETFKVIAPKWGPKDLAIVEGPVTTFTIVPRSLDERVCYPTNMSNRLILTDTDDFDSGTIDKFLIKFIDQNDFKTTHRYSILVRQFEHSVDTYNFLETLNEFSTSESLFSETQPGFLQGNITAEDDATEKVLGFFDIATVSEKRIFFGYRDFFPTERLPDYIDPCIENAPAIGLEELVRRNLVKYIKENEGEFNPGGPYVTVPQVCGDCTILGPSEVPEFWVE